jgi:integrase
MSKLAPGVSREPDSNAGWINTLVSSHSRFGDDVWVLDIQTPGSRADEGRIDWRFSGKRDVITAAERAGLIRAAKHFLWTMVTDPPSGRKRSSEKSLKICAEHLKILVSWLAINGISRFADVDLKSAELFIISLRRRPGRPKGQGQIAPKTLVGYLSVLKDLYRQRSKLEDAPRVDPLPLETTREAAGLTEATKGAIPFIPDPIAVELLSKALCWVEEHGDAIVAAQALRCRSRAGLIGNNTGRRSFYVRLRRLLRKAGSVDPTGVALVRPWLVQVAASHLVEACFIVIAGFVGMRVSEILSMKVGAIERRLCTETGIEQAYIVGRLFKTVDDPAGRIERWIAPSPVVRAVELLEQLGAPLREESGRSDLFLVKNTQHRTVVRIERGCIVRRINAFANYVGVPLHEGHPWQFSSHQFRKSFARFIARRDRSQLLGLAQHFKHVSIAMTARGYVGSDFDLHELVNHESRAETAAALDRFLTSDQLAGRMGERIAAGNARFRGRAGEQVRRDYIGFVMKETDLGIHACDYGWCVFQQETARCGGELAPNEAHRSPAVCLSCANMVVEERHVPYWRDRRSRNVALLDHASPLTRAVLDEAIEQCDSVLERLRGIDGTRQ